MTNQKIWELAKKLGADQVKITRTDQKIQSVQYEDESFVEDNNQEIFNVGTITIYKDGVSMTRSFNGTKQDYITKTLQETILLLRYKTKEVEEKLPFLEGKQYSEVNPKSFTPLKMDKIKSILKELVNKINKIDQRIVAKNTSTYYAVGTSKSELYTSDGTFLESSSGNSFTIGSVFYAKDEDEDEEASNYISKIYLDENDINLAEIVAEHKQEIALKMKSVKIKKGNYEIIFDHNKFSNIFNQFLVHIRGRAIVDGYSSWKDKLDQKILSEKITYIDKPIDPEIGLYKTYDTNGFPTKEIKFIDQGVLKKYLVNDKLAEILKVNSTGNNNGETAQFHNAMIAPGDSSDEEIIASTKKGILIKEIKGIHSGLNAISGDFSVEISGNLIIDGQIDKHIKATVISGNFFKDVAMNIDQVSNKLLRKRLHTSPMIKLSKKLPLA